MTGALQRQNVQVAAGVLNQPPVDQPGAFQVSVQTLGRLADPKESAKSSSSKATMPSCGSRTSLAFDLAALDYGVNSYLDKTQAVGLGIFQLPGSNAIETADKIKAQMVDCRKTSHPALRIRSSTIRPTSSNSPSTRSFRRSSKRLCSWCSSSCCSYRRGAPRSFQSLRSRCRSSALLFDGHVRLLD